MDPMISLGQKITLAEYMILSGADNRPPMLDKDLYDSWKSRMELYMQNREHGRMILESVEHGPLIWPTVEENDVIRTKKYVELSAAEKIQVDCDMKATNIILQGLPADIYSLVNHHRVAKDLWERMKMEQFQVNTKFLNSLPPEWSKFVTDVKLVKDLHTSNFDQLHAYLVQHELYANEVRFAVLVFSPRDDLIACLNKAMAFLIAVASSRVIVQQVQGRQGQNYSGNTYKGNATSSRGNTISGQARVVKCYNCQGEGHMARQCTQPKRTRNAAWYKEKAMLVEAQEAGQVLDDEQLAFLADLGILASQAQIVIPHNATFQTEDLDTYDSNCDDLSTTQAVLMANISNYGSDVISEVPNSETYLNDMDNQSVHALQDFKQLPVMDFIDDEISSDSNIILYFQYFSHEKIIDSQMDDMIREKLALKEQVDSLEQNLSKQIKEKESSDTQVITVKMEILLEPTSNKLMVDSILQAGNLVKEILLKLNLPDHRSIFMDLKIHIKMVFEELKITYHKQIKDKVTSSAKVTDHYAKKQDRRSTITQKRTQDQDKKLQQLMIKVTRRDLYDHPLGGDC
ncbi:retrovirus-related pol polyprotein from transposon TNT 1-94 [Tanacetum coccineum]|uniref:Retrovirus-related pol polyprotein from transposon TNT 1-94 n=1 Tax=Tanacetum coccineum TaxID=301880 RepID=A0ABQ5DE25_9ASTR